MKHATLVIALLASVIALPVSAINEKASMPMHQEYHSQMDTMNRDMMSGMMEKNPDRAFARSMLAHHVGAIAMAETELKYGKDPEMRQLATDIIAAQRKEIQQMQAWVKAHPDSTTR